MVFVLRAFISVYQRRLAVQNDLNFRALTWHRTQDELATHLVNSLFHSQQSKAFVFRVQVKSRTVVNQTELDFFPANRQSGSEVFRLRGPFALDTLSYGIGDRCERIENGVRKYGTSEHRHHPHRPALY